MNIESTIYNAPESNLDNKKIELELSFKSLSFWRKLFLVMVWITNIFFIIALSSASLKDGENQTLFISISIFLAAISFWTHLAVVKRLKGQLIAITVINAFPLMSPIGVLIMLSVIRVTNRELKEHASKNA